MYEYDPQDMKKKGTSNVGERSADSVVMRVFKKSGALGRSSVVRHPSSESSNDALAPEDFKKVQGIRKTQHHDILFLIPLLILYGDPVCTRCRQWVTGDGDDASKERLGCARSINWQPTSASASGAICPGPGPQSRCTVSFNVFFHPSSIRSRANVHSEVAKHIVSYHRDGDQRFPSGIYHNDPWLVVICAGEDVNRG